MPIDIWTAGAEYDQAARARLRTALESLGYTPKAQWWGVGGSQEITHVELVGPTGEIEIEVETYIGLTVKGDATAIAAIRKAVESAVGLRPRAMETLPRDPRVVVVGTSSAGKTRFARALARGLSVPHVELDELHWAPHWKEKSDAEFSRLVAEAVSGSAWVADGNYGVVREILWPRANVIVWLNYSFPIVFWRGLCRSIERSVSRSELWHGNRESFRRAFLSKESILLWILTTYKRRRREFADLRKSAKYAHLEWIEFRRPKEARVWLSASGVSRGA